MVRKKRQPSKDETRRFLLELREDVRLIVRVALFCTLRISEVMGLQWKHIDFENGQHIVEQRYWRADLDLTKTADSERKVKMGFLSDLLKRYAPNTAAMRLYSFCSSFCNFLLLKWMAAAATRRNIHTSRSMEGPQPAIIDAGV